MRPGAGQRQSLPMRWGYTPLHLAATCGYVALVDILLARRADPDAATCGETPLHRTAMVDDLNGAGIGALPRWLRGSCRCVGN